MITPKMLASRFDVPVAEENDFEAIMAVNRKIRLLCGLAPTEHLKESIPGGD